MAQFYRQEAMAWLSLLVLAVPSLALFCLLLLHFRGLLRSLDICLAGLMLRSTLYTLVAVPLLISVVLGGVQWSTATCRLFVFSLHASLLVSLLGTAFFAVDRLFLLRKEGGPVYNGWVTNKVKPLLIISGWSCAAFITGLVPVNLWARATPDPTDTSLRCLFLPSQLDFTYSMIVSACNAASGFICAACSLDSFLHLRRTRHPAQEMVTRIVGSGSGGGSDDGGVSMKPGQQLRLSAEFDARKHAWEAWRVTTLANGIAFFLNHLPMLILDFSALVAWPNRSGSEYIIMLLLESILLPNSLWAAAVRYRHVVSGCSRRNSRADDVYCAMQQFQKRCTLMGSVYRGQRSASSATASTAAAAAAAAAAASTASTAGGSGFQQQQKIQRIRATTAAPAFSLNLSRPLSLNIKEVATTASVTTTSNNGDPDYQEDCTDTGADEADLESAINSWTAVPISAGEIVRVRVPPSLATLPEHVAADEGLWTVKTTAATPNSDLVQQFDDSFYIDAVIVSSSRSDPTSPSAGVDSLSDDEDGEDVGAVGDEDFYLSAAEIELIVAQRRQRELEEAEADAGDDAAGCWPGEEAVADEPGCPNSGFAFGGVFEEFESAAVSEVTAAAEADEVDEPAGYSTNRSLNQRNNFSQEFDAFL